MNKEKLIKSTLTGLAIGLASSFLIRKNETITQFASNVFFFGGIFLLLAALIRLILHLGFFNGVIYSFKKIVESFQSKHYDPRSSEIKSRPEYELTHKRGSVEKELFAACGICMVISFILALI